MGCIQLIGSKAVIQITEQPLQFMCSNESFNDNVAMDIICEWHTNSAAADFYYQGTAVIGSAEYTWTYRAFTSNYGIIHFEAV